MSSQPAEVVKIVYCLLSLERQIVGVKFASTRDDYAAMDGKELTAKTAYCVAVKKAMSGKSLKMAHNYSGCAGSTRALGFEPPAENFTSGELYNGFGLYQDLPTSKSVANSMTLCKTPHYGIMVKPLICYTDQFPDVVIIVADARSAMRVIQGYTYIYATHANFKMTGNQAICVECTAYPLETGRINISMLCSGTRYLAKWKDNEIAIGMPFHIFEKTVKGILKTANSVELDPRKVEIEQNLLKQNLTDSQFIYGYTYYTAIERTKKNKKNNDMRD